MPIDSLGASRGDFCSYYNIQPVPELQQNDSFRHLVGISQGGLDELQYTWPHIFKDV